MPLTIPHALASIKGVTDSIWYTKKFEEQERDSDPVRTSARHLGCSAFLRHHAFI